MLKKEKRKQEMEFHKWKTEALSKNLKLQKSEQANQRLRDELKM